MTVSSLGLTRSETAHSVPVNAPFEAWPRAACPAGRDTEAQGFCGLPKCAAGSLAGKPFAHEDALVPGLGAAPGLLVPDGRIKVLILGHCLVRIEANLAIAAPHRFRLRERQQPPAQSRALPRRVDGNIVEEQTVRPGQQDDDARHGGPFLDYPHHTLRDTRSVVVEHRPGRFSDAGDVMPISLLDDLLDHRHVAGDRGSNTRFIHTGRHDREPPVCFAIIGAVPAYTRLSSASNPTNSESRLPAGSAAGDKPVF